MINGGVTKNRAIKIELFSSNLCQKCVRVRQDLADLVAELGDENFDLEFVDVVKNIDHSVEMGVLTTPSLVIDGKLVASPVPKKRELKTILQQLLIRQK